MKIPKWICSKCNQPFTRRWNANRHCNIKHFGRIENITSFTEYVMNSPNLHYNVRLDSFSQNNNHLLNVKTRLNNEKSIDMNYPQSNTLNNFLYDATGSKLLSYELLDQLGPAYEEMHRILDGVPEDIKKRIISSALFQAISSNNPRDSIQNQANSIRKNKNRVMMIDDLSLMYGPNKKYAKELLKTILDWRYLRD
jgi:hypothetical protein